MSNLVRAIARATYIVLWVACVIILAALTGVPVWFWWGECGGPLIALGVLVLLFGDWLETRPFKDNE